VARSADPRTPAGGEAALPNFEIDITTQAWITSDANSVRSDLCSHGDIRLVIGGRVIAPGDGSGDYTISTSALALLRTLEANHSPGHPVADRLILHCGMIMMTSCPIGIDWSVAHVGGQARLFDVVRYDNVNEREAVHFPGLTVELSEDDYRRQVVAFAEKAKQPFVGIEKVIEDDVDRELYDEFWQEYEERLSRAAQ
jgi:hypothetical protein